MNKVKERIKILMAFLVVSCMVSARNPSDDKAPVFSPVETSHDFGTIGENDGYADHLFYFKNTGDAPLTITRVQASCGCTRPEWTQTPVEPGEEGVIIITYNPKGRLGNFNKSATVYTNEENGYKRHKLTITGVVVEKPSDPLATYTDTIGGVGIEKTELIYDNYYPMRANRELMYIKNYNSETAYFSWENIPEYVTVNCPDSLKADWPGEIAVIIDGTKTAEKKGRIKESFRWTVKDREGRALGSEEITATVNYIDDFNQLSALQSVNSPRLEIRNTQLLFDPVKGGFLGLGGSASKEFTLTNTGKSDLTLHSITSDDSRIHLSKLSGESIRAGESRTVKITVKAKELNAAINTDIYVVCNDPTGPVRKVKVSAQKAN